MKLKEALRKVETSEAFKKFKKENPDFYLAHVFYSIGKVEKIDVGYYNPKTDKMVVFQLEEGITKVPEAMVFKEGPTVNKLEFDKVKITLEKALKIADDAHNKKHPAELVTEKIIILQKLDKLLYNITHVTRTFNIFNIKIDAIDGKVLHEHTQSILGLQAGKEA